MRTVQELREQYPFIEWDEPVLITAVDVPGAHLLCRPCIAERGLHGADVVARAFPTREAFREHLEEEHGKA